MTLRPGHNLIWVAGALLACGVVALFWWPAAWLVPFVGIGAALGAVADYRRLAPVLDGLRVAVGAPAVVGRGRAFEVAVTITRDGNSQLEGEARVELPSAAQPAFWSANWSLAPAGEAATLRRAFRIPLRGLVQFGPVWLRVPGRFQLLERQTAIAAKASVKVLPETFSSRDELTKDEQAEMLLLDKLSQTRLHGPGTEFESLAEFREGDDPRRIDWRATARHRRPIVRRFQIERHRDLMILIDCGRLMGADVADGTKLDAAVDAALMLARVALHGGDRCGVGLFDDQVLGYLSPMSGPRALSTLAESTYALQSRWRESDFSRMFATLQLRQPKRSLVVVLSDIVDGDTTRRYRTSLATLGRRHVVLFAALQTPLLHELERQPIESLLDGSRKAVAFRLLRDRERALHSLKRSGVHVLDVEPQRLTAPLVNQFLELRQHYLG